MLTCERCDEKFEDTFNFCPYCGEKALHLKAEKV
jgi:rRNA maturation endonuclease Nob1